MHLFYADESGSIRDPSQRYFVLAGVAVFEKETHWIEQELNKIAARFAPHAPHSLELHGSPMRGGSHGWRDYPREERERAILDSLHLGIRTRYPKQARAFGVVLEKKNFAGEDIAQIAFEQLSSRFDMFLTRLHKLKQDSQRGLILFDKSATEQRIQTLAREFKYSGHSYGVTRNLAEVPVFIDSRASRLIQLADLTAYALFRHYEHGDSQYYEVVKDCFDAEGGVLHGLYVR